jgi:hypothetical protein
MAKELLVRLCTIVDTALKGSCELIVTAYRDDSGTERDIRLGLKPDNWYQSLLDESVLWLQEILKNKRHKAWAQLGPDIAESKAAIERALVGLQQREKKASRWEAAVAGPAGTYLQRTSSNNNQAVYLRNVERISSDVPSPGTGSPASRITRLWPLAKYNTMLKLEPGKFADIHVI